MNLFLDTNVIIYFLEGENKTVKLLSTASRLATSFITEIELLSYNVTEEEKASIRQFIEKIDVLYADKETVTKTVDIRQNRHLKIPDAIIVAQAQQINFTLATADKEIINKVGDIAVINPLGNDI